MPSVSYRKNGSGLLEIWHPETNSYAPVVTPLQLEGGLRVALADGDLAKVQAILDRATAIEAAIADRAVELRTASERIDGRLALAGAEGRSAADLLLESVTRLGELKSLSQGIRDVSGQIWSALYDSGASEGASAKLQGIRDALDALAAGDEARENATISRLDAISADVAEILARTPTGTVRLKRAAVDVGGEVYVIPEGYAKLSLAVVSGTVVVGGVPMGELAEFSEEYDPRADYPALTVDASGGGRAVGFVYRI